MNEPNPDYVNAPFECAGWIDGVEFFASYREPTISQEHVLWIKMPERQPMHFKNGKWVPWLNPPVGWDSMIPSEFHGDSLDKFPLRFTPE